MSRITMLCAMLTGNTFLEGSNLYVVKPPIVRRQNISMLCRNNKSKVKYVHISNLLRFL